MAEAPLEGSMKEKCEEFRKVLQRIRHTPENAMETAYRDKHLIGMSDPIEWYDSIVMMAGYGYTLFVSGYASAESQK